MARDKATITLDRAKAAKAVLLVKASSVSQAVDIALDRLIQDEELRRDIAAYRRQPPTDDEEVLGRLPVDLDLDDGDIDYQALYGNRE